MSGFVYSFSGTAWCASKTCFGLPLSYMTFMTIRAPRLPALLSSSRMALVMNLDASPFCQ